MVVSWKRPAEMINNRFFIIIEQSLTNIYIVAEIRGRWNESEQFYFGAFENDSLGEIKDFGCSVHASRTRKEWQSNFFWNLATLATLC